MNGQAATHDDHNVPGDVRDIPHDIPAPTPPTAADAADENTEPHLHAHELHDFASGTPSEPDASPPSTDTQSSEPNDPLMAHAHIAQAPLQSPEAMSDKDPKDIAANPSHDHVAIKEEGEPLLGQIGTQIELLEHIPTGSVGGAESGVINNEDPQEWVDPDHELKRVKVYELIGSRWQDQGTAFCCGQYSEETNEALLVARSERNYHEIILSTVIRSSDVYQRQQETLIVWTEPDGVDYALSFQDPEGCAEVWNFILEVQRHMNNSDDPTSVSSPLLGPDTSVTTTSIIRSGHLPPPQLGIISEIERAIKSLARTQAVKERICEYIQQEDYIKSLIEVMHMAEDLESLENLHALCSIMQTILMLNDHSMYEHILEDDIFFGVVGMLEYDPDFPGHKANYREFLHHTSQFHQPIPFRDPLIQRKIHHTYRLQFLKDVVLARALDDSTHNVLNSCIIFNQIDIITHVQADPMFLRDIVRLFVDEEMLAGGSSGPKRIPIPGQQLQPSIRSPQLSAGQGLPQTPHLIISLNGHTDGGASVKPDANAMDIDAKPEADSASSSKLSNGTAVPTPINGRPPTTNKGRSGHYAFAPPENLAEDEINLRKEVVLLLQQLCVMGKNVQLPARLALFRSLVDRGILFAVQWALGLPENDEANKPMLSAAGEVLTALLDHDINGVRGHVLKQVVAIEKEREAKKTGADKAETILEMVCRLMATSRDLAVQSQVGEALKTWMDMPLNDASNSLAAASEAITKPTLVRKDDPGTERYLDYFYKDCAHILMKPLFSLPEWKNVKESILPLGREETNRFVYLCDLFYNFLAQHSFRSVFYVFSSNMLPRVASLLKAKDKHLRHSAFRIFRLLLRQNVDHHNKYMIKSDILKPILDLTIQESRRDNLLSCSCHEYFEHMRRENMKDLIDHCVTKHENEINILRQSPLGAERFELFYLRWQQLTAVAEQESKPKPVADPRGWPGPGRQAIDRAEEDYFNADDDEDESAPSSASSGSGPLSSGANNQWSRSGAVSPLGFNNTGKTRRRPRKASTGTVANTLATNTKPSSRSPQLAALVDYGDDDEEGDGPEPPPPSAATSASADDMPHPPRSERSKSPSPDAQTRRSQSVPPIPSSSSSSDAALSDVPPKRPPRDESSDDELESLSSKSKAKARSMSPSPSPSLSSVTSLSKRRRDEDDDGDELARLSKLKKPDLGGTQRTGSPVAGSSATTATPPAVVTRSRSNSISNSTPTSDPTTGGRKMIKVKLGAVGLSVAASGASSSQSATCPQAGDGASQKTSPSSSPSPSASTPANPPNDQIAEPKPIPTSEPDTKADDTG